MQHTVKFQGDTIVLKKLEIKSYGATSNIQKHA